MLAVTMADNGRGIADKKMLSLEHSSNPWKSLICVTISLLFMAFMNRLSARRLFL